MVGNFLFAKCRFMRLKSSWLVLFCFLLFASFQTMSMDHASLMQELNATNDLKEQKIILKRYESHVQTHKQQLLKVIDSAHHQIYVSGILRNLRLLSIDTFTKEKCGDLYIQIAFNYATPAANTEQPKLREHEEIINVADALCKS